MFLSTVPCTRLVHPAGLRTQPAAARARPAAHQAIHPPHIATLAALLEALGVHLDDQQMAAALEQLAGPGAGAGGGGQDISFGCFLLFFKG